MHAYFVNSLIQKHRLNTTLQTALGMLAIQKRTEGSYCTSNRKLQSVHHIYMCFQREMGRVFLRAWADCEDSTYDKHVKCLENIEV